MLDAIVDGQTGNSETIFPFLSSAVRSLGPLVLD
jgi:hypothetical protein